ncbi:MAG TPA: MFS transporter [Rhizomicrobium sp.]|nr:MFS transporter [Rhizomicrobium sp.]
MTDAVARPRMDGFRGKFFLAFGSIGWGVKDAGMGLLFLFYNQVLGTPAFLAGLAIGAALVVDAIVDPIIGVLSDNWRSAWGRRHPFMYLAAVPVGVFYYMIWTPDPHWSETGLFFYLLIVAILLRSTIAMFEIPSSALVAEMTTDYSKRTEFLSWRWLFGVLGATAISILTFSLWLVPDATHKFGQLNPAGYPKMALVASVVMSVSILISCIGLHRYIPYLIQPPPQFVSVGQMARELWGTLKIKPFFVLVISGVFGSMAAGLSGVMGTYLLTFFWKLNSQQLLLFSFVGVIAAVLAFGIAAPLTQRFEKKHVAMSAGVVGIVAGVGPYIFALFGWVPDYSAAWLLPFLLTLFVVASAISIVGSVMTGSMIADVVEFGALQTGRRNEGAFFAALSLVNKSVSGFGFVLSSLVVAIAGFPTNANPATLDPAILRHLLMVYLPILMVMYLFAIYFFNKYRITRAEHAENVRRLAEIYAETGADLETVPVGAVAPATPHIAAHADR